MSCTTCSPDRPSLQQADTSLVLGRAGEVSNVTHIRCNKCGSLYTLQEWEALSKAFMERTIKEHKERQARPPVQADFAGWPLRALISECQSLTYALLAGSVPYERAARRALYQERLADQSNPVVQKLALVAGVTLEALCYQLPRLSPQERSLFHHLQVAIPPDVLDDGVSPLLDREIFTLEEIARIAQVTTDPESLGLLKQRLEALSSHGFVIHANTDDWFVSGRHFLPRLYQSYLWETLATG